jgi:hypothetical protein
MASRTFAEIAKVDLGSRAADMKGALRLMAAMKVIAEAGSLCGESDPGGYGR